MTAITNPLTIGFWLWLAYQLGSVILGAPAVMPSPQGSGVLDWLAAYGWPQGLPDQDLLARLVALNAERRAQEAAGHVLWLRPDYQAPRYAKTPQVTGELDLGTPVVAFDSGLPIFPKSGYESPAVLSVLMAAGRAMSAEDVSRAFQKHDRRRVQRIAKALHGLALFGHVLPTDDGRYLARLAA
jgi:hypothetical protein